MYRTPQGPPVGITVLLSEDFPKPEWPIICPRASVMQLPWLRVSCDSHLLPGHRYWYLQWYKSGSSTRLDQELSDFLLIPYPSLYPGLSKNIPDSWQSCRYFAWFSAVAASPSDWWETPGSAAKSICDVVRDRAKVLSGTLWYLKFSLHTLYSFRSLMILSTWSWILVSRVAGRSQY